MVETCAKCGRNVRVPHRDELCGYCRKARKKKTDRDTHTHGQATKILPRSDIGALITILSAAASSKYPLQEMSLVFLEDMTPQEECALRSRICPVVRGKRSAYSKREGNPHRCVYRGNS